MRLGSRVVGVLYAANRSQRPFAPEKAVLLGSLAAHAAQAVDNARLLERTRTALEELEAVNGRIRARCAAIERAAQAHERRGEVGRRVRHPAEREVRSKPPQRRLP